MKGSLSLGREAPHRLHPATTTTTTTTRRGFFRMRSLVLPLVVCALLGELQVSADVKTVKLCGREFLRAVVYTCGGSRWRRFLSDSDIMEGPVAADDSSEDRLSSRISTVSRRDINNILTTVCCQVGCRKSDLTYLC